MKAEWGSLDRTQPRFLVCASSLRRFPCLFVHASQGTRMFVLEAVPARNTPAGFMSEGAVAQGADVVRSDTGLAVS